MSTKNKRVATYLPSVVYEKLQSFKDGRSIEGDSQALITILSEFLGVSQEVAHPVTHSTEYVTIEQFNDLLTKIETREQPGSTSELSSELLSRLQTLEARIEALEALQNKDSTLTTGELAKRIGIDSSTLSHWKSGKKSKSPDELLRATREKDPDGIGWIFIPDINRFKPERDLQNKQSTAFQGELLNELSSELPDS